MTFRNDNLRDAFLQVAYANQQCVDDFKQLNITALATSIRTLTGLMKAIDDEREGHRPSNASSHPLADVYARIQVLALNRNDLLRKAIVTLHESEG
jgi:hypothetical protein